MIKRRSNVLHAIFGFLVKLAIQVVALFIATYLLSGLGIEHLSSAIVVAILYAAINALIWPFLSRITLKISVFTFGFFSLFLNAIILFIVSEIAGGFYIEDLTTAILTLLIMVGVNIIISAIFGINSENVYYNNVLRKFVDKNYVPKTEKPGIIYLEIDGLAHKILKQAMENGHAPNFKEWIDNGGYTLIDWETDTSCQTGASQAGILHGDNSNMPAFRWIEKKRDFKLMTSTGPTDAPEIEGRISNGEGVLSDNGASRSNLFTGDANDYAFTYSKLMNLGKLYNPMYYAYFSNPYNFPRSIVLALWDIVLEFKSLIRQTYKGTIPRLSWREKGLFFPIIRAFMDVILRDFTFYTLLGDIFTGQKDSIYATFVAYDEVAHHSGFDDPATFEVLAQLDHHFARLLSAANSSPRKYHIVVLSDHGQTNGSTFKQRYGFTLKDLIIKLMREDDWDVDIEAVLNNDEGWGHLSNFLTEVVQDGSKVSTKVIQTVFRKKISDGKVEFGTEAMVTDINKNNESDQKLSKKEEKELLNSNKKKLIVLASGNLGLIYFKESKSRVTYEEINEKYPTLIPGMVLHDGIGFILVNSKKQGPMVIGKSGTYFLKTDKIEGENPLKDFGENAVEHIRRTNSFKFVPDILVNSFYDPEKDEGAAFEELIGFHGGMGGAQSHPFILFPSALKEPKEKIIGAENVYKTFKRWEKSISS